MPAVCVYVRRLGVEKNGVVKEKEEERKGTKKKGTKDQEKRLLFVEALEACLFI